MNNRQHPQIDFQHVLKELSVNRTDPCEVVRELISNAYDAGATELRIAVVPDRKGLCFFDNGHGLNLENEKNGITPYQAFFSIGKSTKTKGDGGVGYKCQGSKLCFAASRVLVITKPAGSRDWYCKVVENPRSTLSPTYDITPAPTKTPERELAEFFHGVDAVSRIAVETFDKSFFANASSGTLVAVSGFDAENFNKYFVSGAAPEKSYLHNYIRHYTKHGDTSFLKRDQGFSAADVRQVSKNKKGAKLLFWAPEGYVEIPYGFPYLVVDGRDGEAKDPVEVARIRDGRFYMRAAKHISFGGKHYSFILTVDGNRRAHDLYEYLDRKGGTRSGVRLADQRGVWVSANGIKITKFNEILARTELEDYVILADAEASNHYHLIIDGDFELVTNRNAVSRSSTSALDDSGFITELKKFLDSARSSSAVFDRLILRLRREQTDARLSQQIEMLEESKRIMKERERFEVAGRRYVSPLPGEEYLVGVLYAELGNKVDSTSQHADLWKMVLTFSTMGIDTIATTNPKSFKDEDLVAVEYKYSFSATGPFNHALCIVDYIVAWELDLYDGKQVTDDYGCFGTVTRRPDGHFTISDIENVDGDSYAGHQITCIDLRKLIGDTFGAKYTRPPVRRTS